MSKALEINNLSKSYGKVFSLKETTLGIEEGEVVGLVGRNGAGKTTIIKLIMNMIKADSGEIRVFGHNNIEDEVIVKNLIGYVSCDSYLYDSVNLKAFKKLFKDVYDEFDEKIYEKYVSMWELDEKVPIGNLSTGGKMKAMFVLAIAHNPKFLLLDEPTANLDPVARQEILSAIREFVSDGNKSVLFSTHITSDLDKVADKVIMIDNGSIIENAYADDLFAKYVKVEGDATSLEKYKGVLRGINITSFGFNAIAKRSDVSGDDKLTITQANIEELLVAFTKRG